MSKYPEVDKEFLDAESTIIRGLFELKQYEVLLKFVDSSATMTKSLLSDLNRPHALFMKGWALRRLKRNDEAHVVYTKLINDYPYSGKVKYAKAHINAMNDIDKFVSEFSALKTSGLPTTPASLTGLGDVKFSMNMNEIKKIRPKAELELCKEDCESASIYGWLWWDDVLYDRKANISVQISQHHKIKAINILFSNKDNVEFSELCTSFWRTVQFPLLKKYGDSSIVNGSWTWFLRDGKIALQSDCTDNTFVFGVLTLTPDSGA